MNVTEEIYLSEDAQQFFNILIAMLYAAIFLVGVIGNLLVTYGILYFPKMQTVTNIYILNLAIADVCFLLGVPFLIATMIRRQWIFGPMACKVYMTSTLINQFTTALFLLVISADRYIAVCHPRCTSKLRNTRNSKIISTITWLVSIALIFPIFMYTTEIVNPNGKKSCVINWLSVPSVANGTFSDEHNSSWINVHDDLGVPYANSSYDILYSKRIEWVQAANNLELAFLTYMFTLGFALPLGLTSIFYGLIVRKMMIFASEDKTTDIKASRKRVTRMVLVVIAVYVICWLPHWIIQWLLVRRELYVSQYIIILNMFISWLSYLNAAINPILYGFLSKNFRKTFLKAYTKAGRPLLPKSQRNDRENVIDKYEVHSIVDRRVDQLASLVTNKTIDTSFSDSQDSEYDKCAKQKQNVSMETTSL